MKYRKLAKSVSGGSLIAIGTIILNLAVQQLQAGETLLAGILGIIGGVIIIIGVSIGGEA